MEFLISILNAITEGGSGAMVAVLLLIIVLLIFGMKYMFKSLQKKEEIIEQKEAKTEKLIENYYEANKTVTQALNSIHIALVEIKAKL